MCTVPLKQALDESRIRSAGYVPRTLSRHSTMRGWNGANDSEAQLYARFPPGLQDPSLDDDNEEPSMFLTQLSLDEAQAATAAPGKPATGDGAEPQTHGSQSTSPTLQQAAVPAGDAANNQATALLLFGGESAMQLPQSWLSSAMPAGQLTVDPSLAAATGLAGTPGSPLGWSAAPMQLPGPGADPDVLDAPPMGVVALRETSAGQVLPPEIFLTPAALPALRQPSAIVGGSLEVRLPQCQPHPPPGLCRDSCAWSEPSFYVCGITVGQGGVTAPMRTRGLGMSSKRESLRAAQEQHYHKYGTQTLLHAHP